MSARKQIALSIVLMSRNEVANDQLRVAPDPSVKLYREGSTLDRHWIKVIGGRGH